MLLNLFGALFKRPAKVPQPAIETTPKNEVDAKPEVETPPPPLFHPEPALEPESPVKESGEPVMPKPTLKRGSSEKEAVIEMQTLLNTRGGKVGVDGDFGGGSEKALNTIKASLGLPEDGTCDQATWDALPRSL